MGAHHREQEASGQGGTAISPYAQWTKQVREGIQFKRQLETGWGAPGAGPGGSRSPWGNEEAACAVKERRTSELGHRVGGVRMGEEVFPIWPLWVTEASPRLPATLLHAGPEQTLCLCQRPGPMTVPSSWQEAGKQRGKVDGGREAKTQPGYPGRQTQCRSQVKGYPAPTLLPTPFTKGWKGPSSQAPPQE